MRAASVLGWGTACLFPSPPPKPAGTDWAGRLMSSWREQGTWAARATLQRSIRRRRLCCPCAYLPFPAAVLPWSVSYRPPFASSVFDARYGYTHLPASNLESKSRRKGQDRWMDVDCYHTPQSTFPCFAYRGLGPGTPRPSSSHHPPRIR